mgnify:CR=1 FL=1
MSEKLLELKAIYKEFPGATVLEGVNFDLEYGELHALVGENGAGKSTMIKIIAGLHQANCGKIILEGKEVIFKNPKEAINAGISTIHQEFNLVDNLDVAANIFLGRENQNIKGVINDKDTYLKTEKLLERVDARFSAHDPIYKLGVAEKQLVEICKALSVNSKIVIMDEPTAVLSTKEIDKLFEVIRSLKKAGISIIYISHRLEELPQIAERVSVLRDGVMVGELKSLELSKDLITKMMIGRDLTEQFPKSNKKIGDVVMTVKDLCCGEMVKNVSLEVRKGEILGISGLVGSGRTEMARALLGIDKPESGEIYLEGKRVKINSMLKAKQLGVAMVPEERKSEGLVLPMSIEKNISLTYLKKMSKLGVVLDKKIKENSEEIAEKITIKPNNIQTKVECLSGGNQQKVAIGKWIYTDHKVIIFDEPTRGVDVGAKAEIYKIMLDLAERGIAIIMISSDLLEIIGMSDRVLVMRQGEISGELQHEELDEYRIMQFAF